MTSDKMSDLVLTCPLGSLLKGLIVWENLTVCCLLRPSSTHRNTPLMQTSSNVVRMVGNTPVYCPAMASDPIDSCWELFLEDNSLGPEQVEALARSAAEGMAARGICLNWEAVARLPPNVYRRVFGSSPQPTPGQTIHPEWRQLLNGRWVSSGPNLLSLRLSLEHLLAEGYEVWALCRLETAVMAHLSGQANLRQAVLNHEEPVTSYLARMLGETPSQAYQALWEGTPRIDRPFPELARYRDRIQATNPSALRTQILGRPLVCSPSNSFSNMVLSTAADVMLCAMARCQIHGLPLVAVTPDQLVLQAGYTDKAREVFVEAIGDYPVWLDVAASASSPL